MGTYSNPGGPNGTLPDDSKKEEKTTTDPGQLGYHENSHKGMVDLTNAMNNSNPGSGPMKDSTAGTYNFSAGFSLGGSRSGDFANKHISGLKSSLSDTKNPTSSYNQAEKEWKDAGEHKVSSAKGYKWDDTQDDYKVYHDYTKGEIAGGMSYTSSKGKTYQPSEASDLLKDVNIHKDEGGNIIKNISGEEGKTRDRAIINRKSVSSTTSKSKMVSDQGIDVTNSPSLPNKNTGRNTTQTVTGSLKYKYYNEAGTNTGLNQSKAIAQANKEYKASNQYKKDQKAKLKKLKSEAKGNLKVGIDYSNLHETHKKALEGTRAEKRATRKKFGKAPNRSWGMG